MRNFSTGATRDTDEGKLDYEGFLSHDALVAFAEYMNKNRIQADGNLRASDNWQKGIPRDAYMKSAWRHFMEWWHAHRTDAKRAEKIEACCALLFNVQGYIHETLKGESVEVKSSLEKIRDGLHLAEKPNPAIPGAPRHYVPWEEVLARRYTKPELADNQHPAYRGHGEKSTFVPYLKPELAVLPQVGEIWEKKPCPKGRCSTGYSYGVGVRRVVDDGNAWGTLDQIRCGCLVHLTELQYYQQLKDLFFTDEFMVHPVCFKIERDENGVPRVTWIPELVSIEALHALAETGFHLPDLQPTITVGEPNVFAQSELGVGPATVDLDEVFEEADALLDPEWSVGCDCGWSGRTEHLIMDGTNHVCLCPDCCAPLLELRIEITPTDDERNVYEQIGKSVTLGLTYGMGLPKLMELVERIYMKETE